jgi:hypothetical protein
MKSFPGVATGVATLITTAYEIRQSPGQLGLLTWTMVRNLQIGDPSLLTCSSQGLAPQDATPPLGHRLRSASHQRHDAGYICTCGIGHTRTARMCLR